MVGNSATTTWLGPFGALGRGVFLSISYLGRLGVLAVSAGRAVVLPGRWDDAPSWTSEARWMLLMGLPLTALVHVGIGSFLSMQAFFGGTFVDGTGAVVGVGLVRNVAPLLVGFVLSGLFAARLTGRFQSLALPPRRAPREGFLSRTDPERPPEPPAPPPIWLPGRAGAVLAAAALVGPVLAFWSSLVGIAVGWRVSTTLLGISTESYFQMLLDMIWPRDVLGMALKGGGYALVAALLAIHEGISAAERPGDAKAVVETAALRSACFAMMVMLFLNSSWFVLFYLAGPALGPTLLTPPTA